MGGWYVVVAIGVLVFFLSVPANGNEPEQSGIGLHREMNVIVTKIQSGVIFAEPFEGLRPRTISPNKADRAGLHETKLGDELTLVVDEGNILLDVYKAGLPPGLHRVVVGTLDYADVYWGEVKLSTPDGIERFDVDSLAGSKLLSSRKALPSPWNSMQTT